MFPKFYSLIGLGGRHYVPTASDWILATGNWNDAAHWDDTATWNG